MSQFVLVKAKHPSTSVEGISFNQVADSSPLASAAHETFPGDTRTAWNVTDRSGGADTLADEAREAIQADIAVADTVLGRFLLEQIALGHSLCLFWGNDFLQLPQPTTAEGLLSLVTDQLRSDGSANLELYAYWKGAAGAT